MEPNNINQAEKFDFYKLATLTQSLIEIILAEGDLLRDFKVQETAKLQNQKNDIAAKLEEQQKALKENPEIAKSFTAEQIQQLRKLARDYDETIIYYQKQFFKTQKINEITVKMIADAFIEHANRDRGYNHLYSKNRLNGAAFSGLTPALKLNKNI